MEEAVTLDEIQNLIEEIKTWEDYDLGLAVLADRINSYFYGDEEE